MERSDDFEMTAPQATIKGATLDKSFRYRYRLWRAWDLSKAVMLFIMLNPSTADGELDDPTIRRCMAFARREGFGGIEVVNLFAWRATDPHQLTTARDPVGPENDTHIQAALASASLVVVAWGAFGFHKELGNRPDRVLEMIRRAGRVPHCLGTTVRGYPKHPCRLAGDTPIVVYTPPAAAATPPKEDPADARQAQV